MSAFTKNTLIAQFFGWTALILTHILWSISAYGSASSGDTTVIIFWASLFLAIFYVLFILIPKRIIVKIAQKTNLFLFSIGFGIYSVLGFILLIGWIFLNSDFNGVFLDSFFYGLTFGFVFYKLETRKQSLKTKEFLTLLSLPIIFFILYIFILPSVFPVFAFKLVPKEAKEEIVKKTISKFKKGDDFNELKKLLPGYFDDATCDFSSSAVMSDFQYSLVVKNCKIIEIKSGPRKDNGITSHAIEYVEYGPVKK